MYSVHTIIDGVFHRWTAAELKKVIAMLQNPELSLTSTARTRVHNSLLDVQTQQRKMAGVAAMSMRSTRGCGCLDVASLAWAA
jgi:hypothetical protein